MSRHTSIRALLAASAACVAVVGCGGGSGSAGLDGTLGFLPADSPFVFTVDTDLEGDQAKAIEAIAERFPFADQARDQIEQQLESGDEVNFEKDIRPLLGNEFVVGATDVQTFAGEGEDTDAFVGAIEAEDGDKLEELVGRMATEDGERAGATLYRDEGDDKGEATIAIKDATLVVAATNDQLTAALDRAEEGEGYSEDDLDAATEGLAEDALVKTSFDVQAIVEADPGSGPAREIPWVAALRTAAFTLSFADDRVTADLRLATDDSELEEADLPLASGAESAPALDGGDGIGFGLRDPAQILAFGESAGEAASPDDFAQYDRGKRQLERQLDLSIEDDVLGALGNVSGSVSPTGDVGVQAPLDDAAAFQRILRRIGPVLSDIGEGIVDEPVGFARPQSGSPFYALATADGDAIVYGVVDGALVVANDGARAGELSEAETVEVQGGEGAVTMQADAERVAAAAVRMLGGGSGLEGALGSGLVSKPLDALTGSLRAETDGLTGNVTLTFD